MAIRWPAWLFPRSDVRWIAAVLSIMMSLIVLSHRQPINNDGLLYLHVAEVFIQQGFHAAQQIYNWNFYPILIAYVNGFTHLSLLHSALLLNTLFITWLVVMFIAVIKELGGDRRTLYFAMLVIILFPFLNHNRDSILRDFGYWAFYLTAVWALLCFAKQPTWRHTLGWVASMIVATLFRIEGGVIFALAPFAILLQPEWSLWRRIGNFFKLQSGFIIGLIAAIVTFFRSGDSMGRLHELGVQTYFGLTLLTDNFVKQETVFASSVLNTYSDEYARVMLIGALVMLVIVIFIHMLSLFLTLVAGYGIARVKLPCTKGDKRILMTFVLINLLIVIGFVGQNFFITARYLVGLGLIILLWAPFALERLTQWPRLRYVIWAFVVVLVIDSVFHFGPSKSYILDAGKWLRQHTLESAKIYSNDRKVIFYAYRRGNPFNAESRVPLEKISPDLWQSYDFVALRVKRKQTDMETYFRSLFPNEPIKVFGRKGSHGKILLYRKPGYAE